VTRRPCIICGQRRGHAGPEHDAHRAERRRCSLLLRKSWPRLKGLGAVLAFYARRDPPPPTPSPPLTWSCKVLPSGEVVHGVVRPEVEAA
jgi:hypothetical protein